jgi:hypothetical protein
MAIRLAVVVIIFRLHSELRFHEHMPAMRFPLLSRQRMLRIRTIVLAAPRRVTGR